MARRRTLAALGLSTAIGIGLLAAAPAGATIAPTLYAPANCAAVTPAPATTVYRCNDGVPMAGGMIPNLTGAAAITVPAKYGSGSATYSGLPLKAADAASVPGANPATGEIGLDVDVTLPPAGSPPAGGYPLLFLMHGCCSGNKTSWQADSVDAGGEKWHYSDAWFASRGYVVVTYTARGFLNNNQRGSTGQSQLDSRSYEINDYQHLACQVYAAAAAGSFDADRPSGTVSINPSKVVTTGGSYGGGFAWLALTDPSWTCTPDTGAPATAMQLGAAAPRYGWTDLAYALVPNGTQSELPGELPQTNGCTDGPRQLDGSLCPGAPSPTGAPKQSIVSALFLTGNMETSDHATFPPSIDEAFGCLQAASPIESDPACSNVLSTTLPEFMRERSAYYQNDFFDGLTASTTAPVPVFNAGTLTDPLFPAYENRRMVNRLLSIKPDYPIQQYFGDYQHFVQDKAKEWGDICDTGGTRHVCTTADYPGGDYAMTPAGLVRTGATTPLNGFLAHYVQAAGPTPANDVTASLQVCPENAASLGVPKDEPGPPFTASSFEALAPNSLTVAYTGAQQTTSKVPANTHATNADPLGNLVAHGGACPKETDVAGPGVASYSSQALAADTTMIGAGKVSVAFALMGPSDGLQLNARLYDVFPDGSSLMIDRGPRRITPAEATAGRVTWQLHGNGWRFPAGHRIRIELAQDDTPFVRASDVPSSLALANVDLKLPIREAGSTIPGGPDPKPPTGACANRIAGGNGNDKLRGTAAGDRIAGRGGNDELNGKAGDDCVSGGKGKDRISGGSGRDKLKGGSGDDRLSSRDGKRDRLSCGKGKHDRAKVDRKDKVRKDCERVRKK